MTNGLWLAMAVSMGLGLTPWGPLLLYPFTLFTTWAHECSHAVMTVLVGGTVHAIMIRPDTSGVTYSVIPANRIAQGLVASAGYLGASVVGCVLLSAARLRQKARPLLWTVGACMLLTLVVWIRNLFGATIVVLWGAALVALARVLSGRAARFALSLLAVQVGLNAVYDIRVLFLVTGARSDADAMARIFLLPSWAWAGAWMLVSVALFAGTIRATRA
jgi:hypothetical protein